MDFELKYKQLKNIRQVKDIPSNFSLVKDPLWEQLDDSHQFKR